MLKSEMLITRVDCKGKCQGKWATAGDAERATTGLQVQLRTE